MNFEQWQQLSALASKEQDPAKLTDLARKLNVVLNQKTQALDSLLRKPSE
jgi:DNA-binding MarR family transcriptional regulator